MHPHSRPREWQLDAEEPRSATPGWPDGTRPVTFFCRIQRAGLCSAPMRVLVLTAAFTLMWLVCAAAFAATVYKWVDENGVTHYSDQPHPGAKKLDLEGVRTYRAPSESTGPQNIAAASPSAPPPPYRTCEISRPETDEVFLNTHTVPGGLRLDPALREGDRVTLVLDGARQANQSPTAMGFVLTEMARGTHTLLAVIEDGRGTAVCTTPAVTFHVRQPSRQAPNPANRPRF